MRRDRNRNRSGMAGDPTTGNGGGGGGEPVTEVWPVGAYYETAADAVPEPPEDPEEESS